VRIQSIERVWWTSAPRVRAADITLATQQLSALLQAGVALLQALQMLERSVSTPALKEVLRAVHDDVESGSALSAALHQHPDCFSPMYCSMVSAGEFGGILDSVTARLAQTLERNDRLRSRMRSALLYPAVVLCIALAVLVLVLLYVVPVFEEVFKAFGAELPWPTQVILLLSNALVNAGPFLLLVSALAWLLRQRWMASQSLRTRRERWLLRLPGFGPMIVRSVMARWCQTLAALLAAGVPVAEALTPAAQACDHSIYERHTEQLRRRVAQGGSLSEAMAASPRFPELVVHLCATGEETGALGELLGRAGQLMETELESRIDNLSTLLEPLIIVLLGSVVGGILMAMYLPIFRLGQVF
jgi:type IV pilus assembly protein PilC